MNNWMLRGLVFGAAMVVVRLIQGTLIDVWQTQAALISIALLVLFLAGVVFWGVRDGRADAAARPRAVGAGAVPARAGPGPARRGPP